MNNASQGKQMQTFAFVFPRFVQKELYKLWIFLLISQQK